jgi:hypothetical protein
VHEERVEVIRFISVDQTFNESSSKHLFNSFHIRLNNFGQSSATLIGLCWPFWRFLKKYMSLFRRLTQAIFSSHC